jgi:hypothetical protein
MIQFVFLDNGFFSFKIFFRVNNLNPAHVPLHHHPHLRPIGENRVLHKELCVSLRIEQLLNCAAINSRITKVETDG